MRFRGVASNGFSSLFVEVKVGLTEKQVARSPKSELAMEDGDEPVVDIGL
jgi:hypothetical protein